MQWRSTGCGVCRDRRSVRARQNRHRFFGINVDRVLFEDAQTFKENMPESGAPGHGAEVRGKLDTIPMTAASRKWLVAFALLGLAASTAVDLRSLQSDQESRLPQLLRHHLDGLVHAGVSEPVRLDRRRPCRGRRRAVLRLRAAPGVGQPPPESNRGQRTRVPVCGVDAGACGRAVPGLRVVFRAEEVCPLCVTTYIAVIGVFVDLRRSELQFPCPVCLAAPFVTSACW